jgi:hypothetical protein
VIRTIGVSHFWRIAPRAHGLDVATSHGSAPFDDPQGRVGALYGARELRTALREVLERLAHEAPVPRALSEATFEADAFLIVAAREIDLLDLESSAVRERLARDPAVARALHDAGYAKLDRAALLASSGLLTLTQAVSGAALRGGVLDGMRIDGLCVPGSGDDDAFVVFNGDTYDAKLRVALAEALTPEHRTLREVAAALGL